MIRILMGIILILAVAMAFAASGCEDDVKVQRSYEGTAPEQPNEEEGTTVYQKNVRVESEGFDEESDDGDDVKIQRSSESTSETQEEVLTP
ncbi:MAG: hypothetical protein JXA11_07325 [Phycisphaerae bacterium]|nr:hypothetical protein [Phycisphaerae bacterium]